MGLTNQPAVATSSHKLYVYLQDLYVTVSKARICKRFWSPGIYSEESIPLGWESIKQAQINIVIILTSSLKGLCHERNIF